MYLLATLIVLSLSISQSLQSEILRSGRLPHLPSQHQTLNHIPFFLPLKQSPTEIHAVAEEFTCQTEEICNSHFPLAETEAFLNGVLQSWNPPDCATAKFLVLTGLHPYGFGSGIHVLSPNVAMAISDNRIPVFAPDINSWIHLHNCPYFSCIFKPFSHCPLPENWTALALPFQAGQPQHAIMSSSIHPKNRPARITLPQFHRKPLIWHWGMVTALIFRPTEQFIHDRFLPAMQQVFNATNGIPPQRLAVMFIRTGDKRIEATVFGVEKYFQALEPLARQHGIKHLYLGSDDQNVISRARAFYGHLYEIHYLDHASRRKGGYFHSALHRGAIAGLRDLTLLDLLISTYGTVYVGDLRSNHVRLINELRMVNQKGRFPWISPN